jgi:hypothetical protein
MRGSTTFQGWKQLYGGRYVNLTDTSKQLTSASTAIKKKRRSADRGVITQSFISTLEC